MERYIIFDLQSGKVNYVESDKVPVLERDQIVYDESILKIERCKKGYIAQANAISKLYKQSLEYVKEQDMGECGKGLFAQKNIPVQKLYLPYVGLYISSDGKEKYPDYLESLYNYEIINSDRPGNSFPCCLAKQNLCYAHSAQHFPRAHASNEFSVTQINKDACTENLAPQLNYLHVTIDNKEVYLPVMFFTNIEELTLGQSLGWDYGEKYWSHINSGYVQWNSRGEVVSKIIPLEVKMKGEDFILSIGNNPESTRFRVFDDMYCIIFPKNIKTELFNSLDKKSLPVLFVPEKALNSIEVDYFIRLDLPKGLELSNDRFHEYYGVIGDGFFVGKKFLEGITPYELCKLSEKMSLINQDIMFSDTSSRSTENTGLSNDVSNLLGILDDIKKGEINKMMAGGQQPTGHVQQLSVQQAGHSREANRCMMV